ncbi:MAG: thiol-disulfide oxidoreductase [Rhodobacteraceae bacterium]|nr:thiol-disulfide oxidoreductase [Paracoccaceae bacterium]
MRLPQTKKYWTSSYLFFLLIFITGFALAADPSKVESKYIEMSKGDENAPVVFVEYASLTCPACAAFHASIYPILNKEYIKTGKIKFIHREIYFDRAGLWAALTARCTNAVNRYFGMLDLLYSEQPMWSRSESSDEIVKALLKISAKSGIKEEKAISCLEDQEKALDLVNQYQIYVKEDAIESTPTFVINKKKYTNRSYEEIKEIIEKELKD